MSALHNTHIPNGMYVFGVLVTLSISTDIANCNVSIKALMPMAQMRIPTYASQGPLAVQEKQT